MAAGVVIALCLSAGGVGSIAAPAGAESTVPIGDPRTDPQCMGDNYTPTDRDADRAADLMAGRMTITPYGPWTMPPDPDWTEDPFQNSNWVFQYHSLHWLDPLRRVGLATNNQDMLDRYAALVRDWVVDNPVDAPPSRFSWYDMADGFRAIGLVCLAATYVTEPDWLTAAIQTHAQMLSDPTRYASNGNHGLYQNLGLLALGCSLNVPAWRDLAVQRAQQLLEIAVDAEGVTNEGSVLYQTLNHRWYLQLGTRLDRCGLPRFPQLDRIDAMPDLMAHATQPDGNMVAFGDTSAEQRATSVPGTVAEYAASGGRSGPRPDRTFAVFQRGYAFSRSGWFDTEAANQQSLASIRFGAPKTTAIHGHEDAGAVGFFAYGSQLLWQPGLWGGAGGRERAYVLSDKAHNAIGIAGRDYDRTVASPLIAASGTDAADLVTVQSGVYRGATWQRTMVHAKGVHLLVVDDQVSQPTRRSVLQRWQLGADRLVTTGCGRADTEGPGADVTLLWSDDCPRLTVTTGQTSPMLGWRSPRTNEFVAAPTLVARRTDRQVRMTTVIVPRFAARGPEDVQLLRTMDTGDRRLLDIRLDHRVVRIGFSSTGATVEDVRSPSRTRARMEPGADALAVRVTAASRVTAHGWVRVRVGDRTRYRRLHDGRAEVRMPHLSAGRYRIRTTYLGGDRVLPSRAPARTYVVRPAAALER
nr:heparinase II/III family protein [Nocardioides sp. MAH-18]